MARRKLAPDVPEFLEIAVLRAFGCFDAEGRVTAGTAAVGNPVAQLLLDRQGEELTEAGEALVDESFVDPMVLDDHEAEFRVGGGESFRELEAFRVARIECGYGLGPCGLLCLPGPGCRSRSCRVGKYGAVRASRSVPAPF
jgi:hypothetical protein